jgi:hypothetical protein
MRCQPVAVVTRWDPVVEATHLLNSQEATGLRVIRAVSLVIRMPVVMVATDHPSRDMDHRSRVTDRLSQATDQARATASPNSLMCHKAAAAVVVMAAILRNISNSTTRSSRQRILIISHSQAQRLSRLYSRSAKWTSLFPSTLEGWILFYLF